MGGGILGNALVALVALLVLTGCKGIQTPAEKSARQDLAAVSEPFRPNHLPPVLPELTPASSLSNFVTYALLNQPLVAAAYYDWAASVENITVQRSLPDPQLVFQMDILSVVTSVMPGFMQQFPGPGKLKARAQQAGAESQSRYFAFETAVLQTVFEVKRAYYQLGLAVEQTRLQREDLAWLEKQERTLRAQNAAGDAALADVLRAQSELDRARTALANFEAALAAAREKFKAALGLAPGQPMPPVPDLFETNDVVPDADELLRAALVRNPQLAALTAEVQAAGAAIAVAYKERMPDSYLGLMVDAKTAPMMVRPLAGVTLPVWRDKLAAELARAQAQELAAKSRLTAAQIELAASFAEKLFAYRETSRNLALIEEQLLPQAQTARETALAGYRSGVVDFSALTEAERQLLALRQEAASVRAAREVTLADLSLLAADVPLGATFLSQTSRP